MRSLWSTRTVLFWVLLAWVLLAAASDAHGQGRVGGWEMRSQSVVSATDNFFHAAEDPLARSIVAWRLNGRATLRTGWEALPEVYVDVDHTQYEDLGGSLGGGGFLRLQRQRHSLWLRALYWNDRPRSDVDGVVRTADVAWIGGSYNRYGRNWVLQVEGSTSRVDHEQPTASDVSVYTLGTGLRYRGLRDWIQPEVGAMVGWQLVGLPDWDARRVGLESRVLLSTFAPVETSLRVRTWRQRYPVAAAGSPNAERSDVGLQWLLDVGVVVTPSLTIEVGYGSLTIDSTLPERTYATQSVSVGVVLEAP